MRHVAHVAILLLVAGACAKNPYEKQQKKVDGPPVKLIGVHPDDFDCDKFIAVADVAGALGSGVQRVPPDMASTKGVPPACVYQETAEPAPDASIHIWQFQLDCRGVGMTEAQRTMADHKASGQPEVKELAIGRGAVDHTDIRIIAVDDDTDCAAYVVGPELAKREALARLVLGKLTLENAPMTPRAAK